MAVKSRSARSSIVLSHSAHAPKIKYKSAKSTVALTQNTTPGKPISCVAKTVLTLTQAAADNADFVNAFDQVIALMGLHPDNQGDLALIYAVLQVGARYAGRNGPYVSPCEEVMIRLEKEGVNRNAINRIRHAMNSAAEQYSRR